MLAQWFLFTSMGAFCELLISIITALVLTLHFNAIVVRLQAKDLEHEQVS